MKLSWKQVLSAAGLGLASLASHAGNVQWSIGINLPPVATVISSGPGYHHGPVAYPVVPYYAPPVYHVPPRVVYRPAPIYYVPPPVIYHHGPRYHPPAVVVDRRWGKPKDHWHRPGHADRGNDHRWGDYRGPRGGRDHDRGDRRYRPGRD